MTAHQYKSNEALDILIKKIKEKNPQIALAVQSAINVGKDITIESDGYRKKIHVYSKKVPFSYDEALHIAVEVLQSFFIEQPLFVNVTADNFKLAAIGVPEINQKQYLSISTEKESLLLEKKGEEKKIEIELHTETQLGESEHVTVLLQRISKEQIEQQKVNIQKLRELITFGKD